jgi:hypothetical protein
VKFNSRSIKTHATITTETKMAKRKGNGSNESKKKHKAEEDNTHQLDPVFGQYRALPVSQAVIDSVTLDTVPTDGEVYLAIVRWVLIELTLSNR